MKRYIAYNIDTQDKVAVAFSRLQLSNMVASLINNGLIDQSDHIEVCESNDDSHSIDPIVD